MIKPLVKSLSTNSKSEIFFILNTIKKNNNPTLHNFYFYNILDVEPLLNNPIEKPFKDEAND